MMLKHEIDFVQVEGLIGDDAGSKSLSISHFDCIGLYKATTEELPIIFRAESNFVKKPSKPASFYVSTFYTSLKIFLR